MPNDKDTKDTLEERCSECGGAGYVEICHDPYATLPCFGCYVRGLEDKVQQQQEELEKLKWENAWVGAHIEDAQRSVKYWQTHYKQSREENERLLEVERDYDHLQEESGHIHSRLMAAEAENERLRGEVTALEQIDERNRRLLRSTRSMCDDRDRELKQVKSERDDYRNVVEWYGGHRFDDGERARTILKRYERGESQNERD